MEQSSYLPALPEVSGAPCQGPNAERLAAACAKDCRGGGQLHCAIRFQQRCLCLLLIADQGSCRGTLAVLKIYTPHLCEHNMLDAMLPSVAETTKVACSCSCILRRIMLILGVGPGLPSNA